jgi:hypothetical protein
LMTPRDMPWYRTHISMSLQGTTSVPGNDMMTLVICVCAWPAFVPVLWWRPRYSFPCMKNSLLLASAPPSTHSAPIAHGHVLRRCLPAAPLAAEPPGQVLARAAASDALSRRQGRAGAAGEPIPHAAAHDGAGGERRRRRGGVGRWALHWEEWAGQLSAYVMAC